MVEHTLNFSVRRQVMIHTAATDFRVGFVDIKRLARA